MLILLNLVGDELMVLKDAVMRQARVYSRAKHRHAQIVHTVATKVANISMSRTDTTGSDTWVFRPTDDSETESPVQLWGAAYQALKYSLHMLADVTLRPEDLAVARLHTLCATEILARAAGERSDPLVVAATAYLLARNGSWTDTPYQARRFAEIALDSLALDAATIEEVSTQIDQCAQRAAGPWEFRRLVQITMQMRDEATP